MGSATLARMRLRLIERRWVRPLRYPLFLRGIVAIGCIYELSALPDATPWQPITGLCHQGLDDGGVGLVIALLFIGYLSGHLHGLDDGSHWPHLVAWVLGGAVTASVLRRI